MVEMYYKGEGVAVGVNPSRVDQMLEQGWTVEKKDEKKKSNKK